MNLPFSHWRWSVLCRVSSLGGLVHCCTLGLPRAKLLLFSSAPVEVQISTNHDSRKDCLEDTSPSFRPVKCSARIIAARIRSTTSPVCVTFMTGWKLSAVDYTMRWGHNFPSPGDALAATEATIATYPSRRKQAACNPHDALSL